MWFLINSVVLNWQVNYCNVKTYDSLVIALNIYINCLMGVHTTFLQNSVLILNERENQEAGPICFELRVPRKKNNEIFWNIPSKIYWINYILEKNKNIFWFVNISKYHHREMRLKALILNLVPCTSLVNFMFRDLCAIALLCF